MSSPLDLVASLGGVALSGLQFSGQVAMAVGGAAGGAVSASMGAMSKGLGGEASFFDESITVRGRRPRISRKQSPLAHASRPRCALLPPVLPSRTPKSSTCWTMWTRLASPPWRTRWRA